MPKQKWLEAKECLKGKEIERYFKERSSGKVLRINQLLREIKDERGQNTEDKVNELLQHLQDNGLIKHFYWAAKHSWLDTVLKIDKVAEKNDGALVPIQVKTSFTGLLAFEQKYAAKMKRRFGAIPVIVIIHSDQGWENQAEKTAKSIESWSGNFNFKHWQLKYDQLLDFSQHKKTLGRSLFKRIRAVLQNHKSRPTTP